VLNRIEAIALMLALAPLCGQVRAGRLPIPIVDSAERLHPRDDAAKDPGLAAVRRQIRLALAKKDVSLLLPVLAPEVLIDHDRRVPRTRVVAEFTKWSSAKKAEFWRDLRDAIDLGIAIRSPDEAYAPYLFVTLATDEDEVAIVGTDVKVHSAPSTSSPTIEVLSNVIVRSAAGAGDSEETVEIDGYPYVWRVIVTSSGKQGWVPKKYARQATDSGFWFAKINGTWKMASFVVED